MEGGKGRRESAIMVAGADVFCASRAGTCVDEFTAVFEGVSAPALYAERGEVDGYAR